MLEGAIFKETGRATTDEIRRLRKRLETIEKFSNSLTQALVGSGTDTGPVGVQDIYLRLDCTNDPLTGFLTGIGSFWTSVGIGENPSIGLLRVVGVTEDPLVYWKNTGDDSYTTMSVTDAAVSGSILWQFRASDIVGVADGGEIGVVSLSTWSIAAWDSFVTASAGQVRYEADGAPNSLPMMRVTASGFLTGGTELILTSSFTVMMVWRYPDAGNSNQVILGTSGGSTTESIRVPGGQAGLGTQGHYIIQENDVQTQASVPTNEATSISNTWSIGFITRNAAGLLSAWHSRFTAALYNVDAGNSEADSIRFSDFFRARDSGATVTDANGVALAELAIYYGELTDDQITAIYNGLAEKYGFPTVSTGSAAGNFLNCVGTGSNTVMVVDSDGGAALGTNTTAGYRLYVEGTAAITGLLTGLDGASFTSVISGSGFAASGLSTLSGTTIHRLTVSAAASVTGGLTADALTVSGRSTLSQTQMFTAIVTGQSTFSNVTASQITASSIATLGLSTLSSTVIFNLNVTNVTTLSSVTTGRLTASSLAVLGLSTFSTVTAGATTLASLGVIGLSTLTGTVTIPSPAYLFGDRMTFMAADSALTGDGYLYVGTSQMGAGAGFVATRAGSVLGIGWSFHNEVIAVNDTITYHVYKNGASVFSTSGFSTVTSGTATQARGTDTFVAGDVLACFVDVGGAFSGTIDVFMNVEIIYDV